VSVEDRTSNVGWKETERLTIVWRRDLDCKSEGNTTHIRLRSNDDDTFPQGRRLVQQALDLYILEKPAVR